ncbi:hypothetical protein [Burkholderia vietnamiensis]|uniref:hypothetical protein n=1 Tax=Burkholderia vietnamiensis TaxID=60552 RepID=UPI001CF1D239|nr:hypothetical protein [Burkholderia vietnamiensis]MCA8197383.1 hypothetical protein [Burkholderia vietnamiensis]
MNSGTPLTRRQLASIQIARGIPADEIQLRTGMPRASYEVLFNLESGDQDKEFTKMISKTSFDRLIALLGIDVDVCGLRASGVLEWRAEGTPKKTAQRWADAAASLFKELLSERLTLAEIETRGKEGFFARFQERERMLLIYDRAHGIRIAVTKAPADLLGLIEGFTGVTCQRRITLTPGEFKDTREMIRHEVLRSVQFDHLAGVIVPTYTWKDVQAAAREFGFHTDDLVNMMHETAARRSNKQDTPSAGDVESSSAAPEVEDDNANRHNTDYQVAHLRVVSG